MGKRCACDHLIETMCNDPRMRVMPMAARGLWMALAYAWARLPEPGVFIMGNRIGSIQDISCQVSMQVSEVETCLENLKETQMITQREDGVWVLPGLQAAVPRGSVSAQNGRKSLGRPRKGETPDQYKLRLMSVYEGVPEANRETQDKPSVENPPLARVAAKLSSIEAKQSKAAHDVTQIGGQLAEIAGMDIARGMFTYLPIDGWLAEGATPDLLVDVVSAIAGRPNYSPPKTLGYFTQPVREAIARQRSMPIASNLVVSAETEAYLAAANAWQMGGCDGEPPQRPRRMSA